MTYPIDPRGAHFVYTHPTVPLDVRLAAGVKVMLSNGERADVKYARADLSTNGTRELIPAVATKRIMVMGLFLNNGAGAATTAIVKSGTTAISSTMSMAANGGKERPYNGLPYYRGGAVNEAINITLSNGADVGAEAFFIEVPVDVDIAS